MAKGSLRNINCPHGCRKIGKTKEGKDLDLGPKKYKRCCWDKDYWEFFSRLVTKKTDKKTKEETEVVKYMRH